jgi:hypothetical protein
MSPKRTLAAAFFASVLLAGAATRGFAGDATVAPVPPQAVKAGTDAEPAAKPKLVFTYPCTFAYTDGKPYEERRVMDYECDYIHASIKGGKDELNHLPTIEAQLAMLGDVIDAADRVHNEYIKKVAALIIETDPAKVPKTVKLKDGKIIPMPAAERMKRIGDLNILLSTGVFAAASPFLWPAREEGSYVEKSPGYWPASWRPYIQPIYDRSIQLSGMVQADEQKMIDKAAADMDKRMQALAKKQGKLSAGFNEKDPSALDAAFDGGGRHIIEEEPAVAPGPVANGKLPPPLIRTQDGLKPVSDLELTPPPTIPEEGKDRDQRNYFARGYAAGALRLKDDAEIGVWHAMGQTRTIGDPYGAAKLIFHQEGPSCAVSTQFEVLKSRGVAVKIEDLATEGRDKGYFVDYAQTDGSRAGGTSWSHLDSLITDHGVKAESVSQATQSQLDAAVKKTGDAIVYVFPKGFWADPKIGDRETHAVYITGAEQDTSGKIRGYYINDTGTGEAARYISAADFYKVWTKNLVIIDAPRKK